MWLLLVVYTLLLLSADVCEHIESFIGTVTAGGRRRRRWRSFVHVFGWDRGTPGSRICGFEKCSSTS